MLIYKGCSNSPRLHISGDTRHAGITAFCMQKVGGSVLISSLMYKVNVILISVDRIKRRLLRNMIRIKDYLSDADIAELQENFGIVFKDTLTDEAFNSLFDKMVDEEVLEIEKDDSLANKRLDKISRIVTKITTSEKW